MIIITREYSLPIIKKIEISNFKGIKHCTVDDLQLVNLFIGKNDCGKSSILEAVYSCCKEHLGPNLAKCITRRSNRSRFSPKEIWYRYKTAAVIKIDLEFEDELHSGMSIERNADLTRTNLRFGGANAVGTEYDSDFGVYSGGEREPVPVVENVMTFFDRCTFLDCSIKHDIRTIEGTYLNQAKLSSPADLELADAYSSLYGLKKNWEFVPHPDFPTDPSRVAVLEQDKRLFVDGFGDGVRYGMAICACARMSSDTAMFIEEIESHQHPDSLRKLIDYLVESSLQNNLQLFITTHSDKAARYFMYHFREEEQKVDPRAQNMRYFHVERDRSTGKVDCASIDIMNATDQSKVIADLFGRD